jgi:fatty acid desaturase
VFEINPFKAWGQLLFTVLASVFGIYLISITPWYLLPVAWAFTGTAMTGVKSIFTVHLRELFLTIKFYTALDGNS